MADFNTAQAKLKQARAATESAGVAVKQAANLARLDPHAHAADASTAKRAEAQLAKDAATASLAEFAVFTDPRENVGHLSDRSPFALFPVRIETRFATVDVGGTPQHELWLRVYPDDCSIDTFEPDLSGAELANAKRYWQAMWRAGGIEADERAAWRDLVAAYGSDRAAWIVDSYKPTNVAALPVKGAASDEILVIPTQTALSAAEAAATTAYWQAVWLAGNDATAVAIAVSALQTAVGNPRAAELVAQYVPYNFNDSPAQPAKKSSVALSTAFVVFPADPTTKKSSWSQAPRVNGLADRFVVIGYNLGVKTLEAIGNVITLPLIVGPDPSVDVNVDPNAAIHPAGPDLFVPDELQWLVDFDTAVAAGMALRIALTPEQAQTGFDRLLVIGLQLSLSDADGKTALETLLKDHHRSRSGLSLVPQGTPTHNTTGLGSGYTKLDDADQSFDDRKNAPLFTPTPDPLRKLDGQWVAELLGVDPGLFSTVHASGSRDQLQARAMQRALWPATIGYWMDKLLVPIFNDDAVENTRWFFTSYVSGRGAAPALRIGGQPYGILPTTAFSRILWLDERAAILAGGNARGGYLAQLLKVLRAIGVEWAGLAAQTSYVSKPGDAHKTLLDIVGLHPASVEFHARYAESIDELYNVVNLFGMGPDFWRTMIASALDAPALDLLRRVGYNGPSPDILKEFFLMDQRQISNVIDDRPLSETDPIREYTDDHRNYIRWLIDAAKTSLDAINQEQGFSGNKTPDTLLYLYLRHTFMTGYYDASYALHRSAGFLSAAELQAMKPEPAFIHVDPVAASSESRFAALYKAEPRITAHPTMLVSDYITKNIGVLAETRHLADGLDALGLLAVASTAQLERAFAEHIDLCTYRFDAWLLGLVAFQLDMMRNAPAGDGQPRSSGGIYLGAYAWLEDLRPSSTRLVAANVPDDLKGAFGGPAPLLRDPTNGGYVHAPSLTHARTAAVLRSGYLANATPANPETMSVNLSSDRVRTALSMLEGIRNGQSLGALLGYQFERGLHDDHGLAEVDKFIYPMRKAFPLVADAITTTKTAPSVPIEAIEARNVLDGLKLVAQTRASGGNVTYPFGLTTLPGATTAEAGAINAEVNELLDAYGAIADLALAEGVHQAVQGNFERIAATLDAYSTGNFPPEPEVVRTPPSGIGLTHRVAVHFQPGLGPPPNTTPRATAEPALDAWLASVLPALTSITCTVTWTDPVTMANHTRAVGLADLGLRPIDVLELLKPDNLQSMKELDDRILGFVAATDHPRPDAVLRIAYMTAAGGTLSMFEAGALVRALKALVAHSRPLHATDAMLHKDATPAVAEGESVDRARIAGPLAILVTLRDDASAFVGALGPLVADPVANRAAIVAGVDGSLEAAATLLERASRFNLPQSGWGFAFAWKQAAYADLMSAVVERVGRWEARLADFDARVTAYDALPAGTTDAVRFFALQGAEAVIAAKIDPLPPLPGTLRASLDAKRATFSGRINQFRTVLNSNVSSFATTLAKAQAIPTADLDPQALNLTTFEDRGIAVAEDLVSKMTGLVTALASRCDAVQAQLDAHDAAASASAKVQALDAAAKALLGSDFRIFPEFTLSPTQGDAWANAYAASTAGTLTQYLTTTLNVDFPVDEWLYGVARVRPSMRWWEQTVLLAGALGSAEPALTPVQFPYEIGAPWVAMEYPSSYVVSSERLLYTAQYVVPFDKTVAQCGLLVDEWTEVLPAGDHDTGITFNFRRPDNEAPQSILLVTPATGNGAWQWDDLVGALNETLDLAKMRVVEPAQVDTTAFARLLPATVLAVSLYAITISTALAAANRVFDQIEMPGHA